MTREQQVALDAMRSAWPEETVARMLRAVDGEFERLALAWAAQLPARPWTDHACVECVPDEPFYSMRSKTGWTCFYHRALALSPAEAVGQAVLALSAS